MVEWKHTDGKAYLLIEGHIVATVWHEPTHQYCFQIMKTNLTDSKLSKGYNTLVNAKSALVRELQGQLKLACLYGI